MKQRKNQTSTASLRRVSLTCLAPAVMLLSARAHAAVVFSDDFESPDVGTSYNVAKTSQDIDTSKWVLSTEGFAGDRTGIVNEAGGDGTSYFTDPDGSQAWAGRYDDNAGVTSAFGQIGTIATGQTITVTFDAVQDDYMEINDPGGAGNGTDLDAYLVLFDGAGIRDDVRAFDNETSAVLASLTGAQGVNTTYQTFSFSYTVGDNVDDGSAWDPALLGDDMAVRFAQDNNAIIDNVEVSVIPEPGSLALFGLAGLGLLRRRR